MSEEINKIIDNLEGCIGMFDYLLTPIESNLLVLYIKELQQENKKYKEVIDKIKEKCKQKTNYDYDVWVKLSEDWKTLDDFNENIKYNLHPIITDAYRCDIKNSINKIIEITKKDVVLKEDILDILKEVE